MASPSILTRDQMQAQYGVNPDQAQGWDSQNNRYNTNQSGQYLYHGDVGGGNVGWYAGATPYANTGTAQTTNGAGTATGSYTGSVDPSLQTVKPATGSTAPLPYSPSIPLGNTNPYQTPGIVPDTSRTTTTPQPGGGSMTTVADDFGAGAANGGSQGQLSDMVRQRLLDLLGTDINNVSVTDADVAPQSRAYGAAVDREAAAQRGQALQAADLEGTSRSGATQGTLSSLGMQAAQAKGANDASLIGTKQQQRIDQLKTAISVASSMGMAEQANDLQRQLANLQAGVTERGQDVTREGQQIQLALGNLDASSKTYLAQLSAQLQREGYGTQERLAALDAEVRKLGINTQGNLGQLDIALRTTLGTGQLNLGLLQTLLGNNQANNSLGFSYAQLQALMNGQAATFGAGGG